MENKQKEAKFNPTPEMLVFAEFYILNYGNISKACEAAEVDRGLYYNNWRKQEGFELWLSEHTKKEVLKHVGKWYLIAERFAMTGSYKHLELLMEIGKEFAPGPLIDASKHTHYNLISSLHQSAKEYVENGDGADNRIKDSLRVA